MSLKLFRRYKALKIVAGTSKPPINVTYHYYMLMDENYFCKHMGKVREVALRSFSHIVRIRKTHRE